MGDRFNANVPLLGNSHVQIPIEDVYTSGGTERRCSSTDEGNPLFQQLSGKWQFQFLGKDIELFEETQGQGCLGNSVAAKEEYYRRQRATVEAFREVDLLHSSEPMSVTHMVEPREGFAVYISNLANMLLLFLKVYASISSRSIAILASTLDSLLDLLAGAILWFTRLSMRRLDIYKYPIGKSRVQPVGIIIFSAVMATLGLQVLLEALRQLIGHESAHIMDALQLTWLSSIMATAVVIKLGLFIYCRSFQNEIVQAYAKDHYFDVITNLVGVAAALLAYRFFWWMDPSGAIILALYTIINWSKTVLENAASLIGKGAPPEMLQKLTYLAFNHHHQIKHIDTVRAYTFGSFYFVEVDIELPEDMPLKEAHHIGETLQDKFERLPEVERAFVHLDFECQHKPEHFLYGQKYLVSC